MGLISLMLLLEKPFQQYGTKFGAGSADELRWFSQPHGDKHVFTEQSGNLWTNEQCGMIFFSVKLLGDVSVVNHIAINYCCSGIF